MRSAPRRLSGSSPTLIRSLRLSLSMPARRPETGSSLESPWPWTLRSLTIELLESYRVLVDGVVVEDVPAVEQGSIFATYSWAPPFGALPSTAFTVRVEGRDYASNVGFAEWQLMVPPGAILSGSQTLDSTLDGEDLTLGAGTFTATSSLNLQALTLTSGAQVVPSAGVALDLSVTGQLRIQCGASFDATGLGYAGGTTAHPQGYAPDHVLAAGIEHGGSHGGGSAVWNPAQTSDPPGDVYDSVYSPYLGGGGAGRDGDGSGNGLSGGGVITLAAGSVILDGDIHADGRSSDDLGSGGGAGGTVRIDAGSLVGNGRITADGGWVRACSSTRGVGTGGGGRVALRVDDVTGFDAASQVQAWGAALYDCSWGIYRYARPGTVYVRDGTSTYGDLIVDAGEEADGTDRDENTVEGMVTELPALGEDAVTVFETAGVDAWVTAPASFTARWLGAWMVLADASASDLGEFEVLELDATGRARLSGAGSVVGAASYRGEYQFDDLLLRHGAGLLSSDPLIAGSVRVEDASRLPVEMEVGGDVTVAAGATASVVAGSVLRMQVAGTLRIEAGAVLDANGAVSRAAPALTHRATLPGPCSARGSSTVEATAAWARSGIRHRLAIRRARCTTACTHPCLPAGERSGWRRIRGWPARGWRSRPGGRRGRPGRRDPGRRRVEQRPGVGWRRRGDRTGRGRSLAGGGSISADGGWVRACSSTRGSVPGAEAECRYAWTTWPGSISPPRGGPTALHFTVAPGGCTADAAAGTGHSSRPGDWHRLAGDLWVVRPQPLCANPPVVAYNWSVYRCSAPGTVLAPISRPRSATSSWAMPPNAPAPPSSRPLSRLPEPARSGRRPTPPTRPISGSSPRTWRRSSTSVSPACGCAWAARTTGCSTSPPTAAACSSRGPPAWSPWATPTQGVYKFDTVTVRGGAVLEFLDTAEARPSTWTPIRRSSHRSESHEEIAPPRRSRRLRAGPRARSGTSRPCAGRRTRP